MLDLLSVPPPNPHALQICTELITNNAAAALATPIAFSISRELEVKIIQKVDDFLCGFFFCRGFFADGTDCVTRKLCEDRAMYHTQPTCIIPVVFGTVWQVSRAGMASLWGRVCLPSLKHQGFKDSVYRSPTAVDDGVTAATYSSTPKAQTHPRDLTPPPRATRLRLAG